MAKLVIPRGLQASGKSTKIKQAIQFSSAPAVRVGRDFLRDQLFGTRLNLSHGQENLVSVAEKAQVESFLKMGVDVYVDAMHLRNKYVREWAKIAGKYGVELVIWDEFLNVPLEECVRRDALRTGEARVGEDVIRAFHDRFFPIPPLKLDDIESPVGELYVPNYNTPYAYMVDIDGTCTTGPCDRSPYEWMKVGQDEPRESVVATVYSLYQQGRKIIFCSGRDEVCREPTMDWLVSVFGPTMMSLSPLFMRKQGDNRKDNIVKLELFNENIRDNYNVIGVFDDRDQVVEMWRSIGLTCYQVAPGSF